MTILPQLLVNSLVASATYILITLGFNLIYGATKFVNMAHGVVAASGGYAAFLLTRNYGFDIYSSVILGVLAAGCVGFFSDRLVFLPLRKRKASNLVLFISSLGIFTIIQAVLAMIFSPEFKTFSHLGEYNQVFEVGGAAITQIQVIIIALAVLVFLFLTLVLNKTIFGKAVKAVSDDEEVSKIVGINTDKITGYVFFIGSSLAGLAGIMVGLDTGIQPTMGLHILLEGAISSIIGGIGNIYGGVLGSLLLGFTENFGIWKISSEWKIAISMSLLVIFLIFRPQGIMKK